MTTVEPVNRILPGTPEFADLLAQIRLGGAKDRDLNDENPFFDEVRAQASRLRYPALAVGARRIRFHCPSIVFFDGHRRRSCRSDCGAYLPDSLLVRRGAASHLRRTGAKRPGKRAERAPVTAMVGQGGRGPHRGQRLQREGIERRRQSCIQYEVAARPRWLPADRREVLQHRNVVRRLPDRHRHHRP